MRLAIIVLAMVIPTQAQTQSIPVVYHQNGCRVVMSEDRCVGCQAFVPTPVWKCQVYLTGGDALNPLWPTQANPAEISSLEMLVDGEVLPASLEIAPGVGLVGKPGVVGKLLGDSPIPQPPTGLKVQVS